MTESARKEATQNRILVTMYDPAMVHQGWCALSHGVRLGARNPHPKDLTYLLAVGLLTRFSASGLFVLNIVAVVSYYTALKDSPAAIQDYLEWGDDSFPAHGYPGVAVNAGSFATSPPDE